MTHVKGSDDEQRIGDENKEKKRTARKQEQIWLLVRAAREGAWSGKIENMHGKLALADPVRSQRQRMKAK